MQQLIRLSGSTAFQMLRRAHKHTFRTHLLVEPRCTLSFSSNNNHLPGLGTLFYGSQHQEKVVYGMNLNTILGQIQTFSTKSTEMEDPKKALTILKKMHTALEFKLILLELAEDFDNLKRTVTNFFVKERKELTTFTVIHDAVNSKKNDFSEQEKNLWNCWTRELERENSYSHMSDRVDLQFLDTEIALLNLCRNIILNPNFHGSKDPLKSYCIGHYILTKCFVFDDLKELELEKNKLLEETGEDSMTPEKAWFEHRDFMERMFRDLKIHVIRSENLALETKLTAVGKMKSAYENVISTLVLNGEFENLKRMISENIFVKESKKLETFNDIQDALGCKNSDFDEREKCLRNEWKKGLELQEISLCMIEIDIDVLNYGHRLLDANFDGLIEN